MSKHPGGRPSKWTSVEAMQSAIDNYFADCEENEEPLTISGLAYALDMTTETLRAYGEKDQFSVTVKKAKQKVEAFIERRLLGTGQAAGAIFNLKNNFGWKDKTEVDNKHDISDGLAAIMSGLNPTVGPKSEREKGEE